MEKFDTYCRLCLTQSEPLIAIFGSENNIPLQLSTCLSIELTTEDLLPKSICNKCSDTLHSFYMFYINSKCCEQWLLTCLSNEPSHIFDSNDSITVKEKNNVSKIPMDSGCEFLPEFLDMGLPDSHPDAMSVFEYLTCENENNLKQFANDKNIKVTKLDCSENKSNSDAARDYYVIRMDVDVLDSDLDIVNDILAKQSFTSTLSTRTLRESYSCRSCKAMFQDFEELAHHMGGCDALKRTCSCCGILFKTKESMLKHKNVHNELTVMTCEHCHKQFIGKGTLKRHIDESHSDYSADSGVIYRCKQCNEYFESKETLYNHAKTHVKLKNKNNSKKFICDECNATYFNENELNEHKKTKHQKQSSCMYRCKVCLKIFTDRDVLYKHVKQHTSVLERTQHLCDSCGQSFNSYNTLSKHVLTHVGNQFQCMICFKPFINGSLLKKHLATHEIETQICELCGLIFSNDILLNMHQSDVHSVLF